MALILRLLSLLSPAVHPPFPSSRILTNETWGATMNRWAEMEADRRWVLCYSSFKDAASTDVFHKQCDQFGTTMTVAHNSIGRKFGGFVRLPALISLPRCITQAPERERERERERAKKAAQTDGSPAPCLPVSAGGKLVEQHHVLC